MTRISDLESALRSATKNTTLLLSQGQVQAQNIEKFLSTLPTRSLLLEGAELTLSENPPPARLAVTGKLSTSWRIKGVGGPGLGDIHVVLTFTYVETRDAIEGELTLDGILTVGSKTIPVTGELTEEGSLHLHHAPSAVSEFSLAEIADFAGGSVVRARLPIGVKAFDSVSIRELELTFGHDDWSPTFVSCTVAAGSDWHVVPDFLTLIGPAAELATSYYLVEAGQFLTSLSGSFRASTQIGRQVAVTVPFSSGTLWELDVDTDDGSLLPSLVDLASLAGARGLADTLEKGLADLGLGKLSINGVAVGFELPADAAASIAYVSLAGQIKLAGVSLDVHCLLPDLQLGGQLSDGSTISLKAFVQNYFQGAEAFPTSDITALAIGAYPAAGAYTLYVEIEDDWQIPVGKSFLAITQVMLEIRKMPDGLSGAVAGAFQLADLPFSIEAQHPDPGAGWVFEGFTPVGEPISLNLFAGELLDLFDLTLPSALPDMTLRNLDVVFDTRTRYFRFTGATDVETQVTLGSKAHTLHAAIDIQSEVDPQSGKRTFAGSMTSELTIGAAAFQIHYAMGRDTHVFYGSYQGVDGASFGLIDLTEALGMEHSLEIPVGLDLSMTRAVFEFHSDQELFMLVADSTHGQANFVAAKPPQASGWEFVFWLSILGASKLSELPAIGGLLADADFLTLRSASILLAWASAGSSAFAVPELPALAAPSGETAPADSKPAALAAGTRLSLSAPTSVVALIDIAGAEDARLKNLHSIVGRGELLVQALYGGNLLAISAALSGNVGIPTGKGSDLGISDARLQLNIRPDFELRLSGALQFHIDSRVIDSTLALVIDEAEAQATVLIKAEQGSLPAPLGLKGLHFESSGAEMGVVFEPPGLDLGLQGSFHIGDRPPASDDFALVMEVVEIEPNPLLLAFHLDELDIGTALTVFTDKPASSYPDSFTAIKATDLSFHWAESLVVLPDSSITQPGFWFSGNIDVFGFKAHASLKIDPFAGVSGDAEMDPIHIGQVLSITGAGQGISVNCQEIDGECVPISNTQIIAPTPATTRSKKQIVAPGGPVFKFNSRGSPYVFISWKITLFDLVSEQMEVEVDDSGFRFKLEYDLTDIAKLELDCTLDREHGFKAHAQFRVDINARIGPIEILEVDLGTIKLDTQLDAEMDVVLDPSTFSMKIRGHFEFDGATLNLPELELAVAPSALKELPGLIIEHIKQNTEHIFKDLYEEGARIISAARDEAAQIEQAAEHEAEQIWKSATDEAVQIEQAAEAIAQRTEHTAEQIAADARQIEGEAEQIARDAEAEVERIASDAEAAADALKQAAEQIIHDTEAEVLKIAGAVEQEVEQIEGRIVALGQAAEREVARIAAELAAEVDTILGEARDVARKTLDAAARAVEAIEQEAEQIWKDVKSLASKAAHAIESGAKKAWHTIFS